MSSAPAISAGMVIGSRYVLLSQIAVGGMGEVWRARDILERDIVAIKILKTELAGQQQFLTRLRIEAENIQRISQTKLAAVLDHGEQNGLGWLAMELVEGNPLSELLAGGKIMRPEQILPIIYSTALALEAVHDAGVVHRDIKPGNILLTPAGHVKLTDFGISKTASQETLTQAGMVMGTAQYLPPEQAIGEEAAAHGDLYALGVIFYEALVGKRPFTGQSQVDIAFAHVNSPVPPLPDSVPGPITELVNSLLEKEPADRPANAAELATRLRQIDEELSLGCIASATAFANSNELCTAAEMTSATATHSSSDADDRSDSIADTGTRPDQQATATSISNPPQAEHAYPDVEILTAPDDEVVTEISGGMVAAPPEMPPSYAPNTATTQPHVGKAQVSPQQARILPPSSTEDSSQTDSDSTAVAEPEPEPEATHTVVAQTETTDSPTSTDSSEPDPEPAASNETEENVKPQSQHDSLEVLIRSVDPGLEENPPSFWQRLRNWLVNTQLPAEHSRTPVTFLNAATVAVVAFVLLLLIFVIATLTSATDANVDAIPVSLLHAGRVLSCLILS